MLSLFSGGQRRREAPQLSDHFYVASASEDDWADPVGEYFSLVVAASVYKLFGYDGITDRKVPEIEHPVVVGRMGHHIRRGEHNVRLYDWQQFVSFADRFLK